VTVAVVPFKDLESAKERLADRLSQAERRRLVLAMLDDVLGALSHSEGLSALMVVTGEPEIASRASRFGAEILEETTNEGHTAAVERAVRELERRRALAMLCIPGDVPAMVPEEVAAMLRALGPPPAVVIAPSRNGRGTNAVLVSPPGALSLRFGEPSFLRHVERARDLGLRTEIVRLPGLALDLDTPADLDIFLESTSNTATYRLLRASASR
jgi:2-phospho-L-lactate guanylyltransferase